ncbi:MAG: serine hydrolase domain-containing protein [Pseudoxanthomonas sp.]
MNPLSRRLPRLAGPWLLWLLLVAPAWALEPAQVVQRLEQLRRDAGAPGASAALMVGGHLVYSGGVGFADAENEVPMTGRSVHDIGSESKLFGAIGTMQLVERGKADLDAQIQVYAPWFPRKQAPITVRQLMTHTSGIRHYRDGEFGDGEVLRFRQFDTLQEASKRWQDEPLLFAPGSHWYYTTYGASLLQAVIETGSGEPLEQYLREHVWIPAGMLHTGLDIPARIVAGRARGYELDRASGRLENAQQENVSYKFIGGGIIGSDEDMVRLGHALNSGVLLGRKALAEMYRPQLDPKLPAYRPDGDTDAPEQVPVQALIWRVLTDGAGRRYYGHSGSVKGTLSYFANYADRDVVVALHVNASGGKADLKAAAEDLAALALAK